MYDLLIQNGTVVTENGTSMIDIAVDGETIAELGETGSIGRARETIDASGLHVLPGVVDVHFHCRAPSHPERGTFGSETRAAAAGGVTTVLEMPISDPACSTPEVFLSRKKLGENECYVDFGLFSGAALKTRRHVDAMVEVGAIGFKLFTHDPPPNRESEFNGLWASTDEAISDALDLISETDLTCTVHAESQALLTMYESQVTESGTVPRPPEIEAAAIDLLGKITEATGAKVHIAHMSSAASVEALTRARTATNQISGETAPHYLIFGEEQIREFGSFVRVAPPLRTADDNKSLWEALRSGVIEVIASDHAPFTPADKDVPYHLAPRGIPGIELMLPVIMDGVAAELISLEQAVRALSEAPSRLFGLFPKKGAIRAGSDADLVLWDSGSTMRVALDSLRSRSAGSAVVYDGMTMAGRLVRTILRGKTVFDNGSIVGESRGQFVRPTYSD